MKYQVVRNIKYDYAGENQSRLYPQLHRYPAAMPAQLGADILKEFNAKGILLDPYCGSGSSFASALECGIEKMFGFDINPLAVLISRVKFTKISKDRLEKERTIFRNNVFEFLKNEDNFEVLTPPPITNIDFWFSKNVVCNLSILKFFIDKIKDKNIRNFFLIPFSAAIRECSYTRNNEFKLYRMKEEDIVDFNPDIIGIYFKKLRETCFYYVNFYLPKLKGAPEISIERSAFKGRENFFDVVLTSPPYGDSKTTVAYGQFSSFSNEWLGFDYARKLDSMMMGGSRAKQIIKDGIIADYIDMIEKKDMKRALEISSFYSDLSDSIKHVARSVQKGAKAIYIVGNRTVKEIVLPTDQFIAEQFEKNGFKHIITYKRALSNKVMPSKNSPTNEAGKKVSTMLEEYITVCEKTKKSKY
jgi:16S rRNA G966 N2-methylase RsmD